MSSTPNYGFQKTVDILAVDTIDRELKRVEDKVDQHSALITAKVDKADGYSLIHKKKLERITHNQNHIECLSKRIDRADSDIADRYTKSETDAKLQHKADKCELEKHMIDPDAHGALLDKMYTQAEVDALLAEKVDVDNPLTSSGIPLVTAEPPIIYTLPLHPDFTGAITYSKNQNGLIVININVTKTSDFTAENTTIATLPVGFRTTMIRSVGYVLQPGNRTNDGACGLSADITGIINIGLKSTLYSARAVQGLLVSYAI